MNFVLSLYEKRGLYATIKKKNSSHRMSLNLRRVG
jgi:hypothetical protein